MISESLSSRGFSDFPLSDNVVDVVGAEFNAAFLSSDKLC